MQKGGIFAIRANTRNGLEGDCDDDAIPWERMYQHLSASGEQLVHLCFRCILEFNRQSSSNCLGVHFGVLLYFAPVGTCGACLTRRLGV